MHYFLKINWKSNPKLLIFSSTCLWTLIWKSKIGTISILIEMSKVFHYIHHNIYMVSIQYFWMCLLWHVMVGFGIQVVESRSVKLQPISHFYSESWIFLKLEYKPICMKQHTLSTWINLPLSFPIHLCVPSKLHIWWTKFSNIIRKEDYSFWHNSNTLCWVHIIQ